MKCIVLCWRNDLTKSFILEKGKYSKGIDPVSHCHRQCNSTTVNVFGTGITLLGRSEVSQEVTGPCRLQLNATCWDSDIKNKWSSWEDNVQSYFVTSQPFKCVCVFYSVTLSTAKITHCLWKINEWGWNSRWMKYLEEILFQCHKCHMDWPGMVRLTIWATARPRPPSCSQSCNYAAPRLMITYWLIQKSGCHNK